MIPEKPQARPQTHEFSRTHPNIRQYVVEFVGTFFLVLTIGGVVIDESAPYIAPLAVGTVLMAAVLAGGHISGAHYNPAVTLAMWMRGHCDSKDLQPYIAAQLGGAIAAALLTSYLTEGGARETRQLEPGLIRVLLGEFLFAFALVWVFLNGAERAGTNSYLGLSVGFVAFAGVISVGQRLGSAFNPAVAIGLGVMRVTAWADLWVFLVADFLAGTAAATICGFVGSYATRE